MSNVEGLSRKEQSACPVATKEHIGDCTGSKVESRMSNVEGLSRKEQSDCPVATKEHIGDCTGSKVECLPTLDFRHYYRGVSYEKKKKR
jgi:hypothetical protein